MAAAPKKRAADTQSSAGPPPAARPGKLPDEALKRAQEAEQQLKANKPNEALSILSQLDRDYPGTPAISLRLAQIYDKQDTLGAALFYYRRYARLAGDSAREEASARLAALEVTPGAKDEAQQFAGSMHEPTAPVATPISVARHEVAAERTDGSLVPLKGPDQLAQLAKTGSLPDAPAITPVPSGPTPYVINPQALEMARANASRTRAQDMVLSGNGNNVTLRSSDPAASSVSTPAPALRKSYSASPAGSQRSTYASPTPAAAAAPRDEDAELATAFAQHNRSATPEPTQLASTTNAQPGFSSAPAPVTIDARPSPTPEIAYMSPTPAEETDSRAGRFFSIKNVGGSTAILKLYNDIPDSVLTIKIVPEDEGDVLNAIVTKDENRTIKVPPGKYNVAVTISTSNYPPLSMLDTHFPFQFRAGTQYLRRFNPENVQEMK